MRGPLAALALALFPGVAAADSIEVVGGQGRGRELSHVIDVSVEPGQAILRVDRTFSYSGPGAADLLVEVQLPQGGVVTGLGTPDGGQVEAHWRPSGAVLVVPAVGKGNRKRVSYRVEVPLTADDGHGTIWLPQATTDGGVLAPVVRQRGEVLLSQHNPSWDPVEVTVPTSPEGQARWGAAKIGAGWVWRTEVDAPPQFGKAVKDAHVVFVLDASRSQGPTGMSRQLALLHEWARAMPRARFMVVAYNRGADTVFPTWKRAEAMQDIGVGHSKLVLRNGSQLDAALPLAAKWLRDIEGPAFVVVATDGEVRSFAQPATLAAQLAGLEDDKVVHVVITSGRHRSGAIETRADRHRLAPIALLNRGVPLRVYLPQDWPEPPERVVLQNLLRVTRIDGYDTAVDGRAYLGDEAGTRLYERAGVVAAGRSATEPKTVAPIGLAWGSPWTTLAVRTAAVDRRAAIFAASAVKGERLGDAELEALGKQLEVVTARTALRAGPAGLEVIAPRPFQTAALGEIGGGAPMAEDSPPEEIREDDLRVWFSDAIAPCVADYTGRAELLNVSVELSWNEILDVSAPSNDAATGRCIEDSIWAVELAEGLTAPHAFGMLAVDVAGSDRDRLAAAAGPPRTRAARVGGCRVAPAPVSWAWLILLLSVGARRRYRKTRPS